MSELENQYLANITYSTVSCKRNKWILKLEGENLGITGYLHNLTISTQDLLIIKGTVVIVQWRDMT